MTTTAPAEPGTLHHVPPKDLLCERNIRDIRVDGALADSVKDLGVLQPITAVVNDDGKFVVRHGHRRTFAAIAANLATVPVYVVGSDDLADAAEVDRIIRQRDENTARDGLTAAEEFGVVEQLALLGVPAGEIHERARMPKAVVDAANKVRGSKVAVAAAKKYSDLSLEHVEAIADFDDDKEAVKALTVAAIEDPDRFAHVLSRLRRDRHETQERARVTAELEAAGVKIVEARKAGVEPLSYLMDKPGGHALTEANHKDCKGHVGWPHWKRNGTDGPEYEAEYGCSNWKRHGHHHRYNSGSSSKPKAADLPQAEREAAAKKRKLVIENNRAWAAAADVRRGWLKDLAKQKTAPKGAAAFIVRAIATHSSALSDSAAATLAVELLALRSSTGWKRDEAIKAAAKATEGKSLLIALVMVLAAYEESWAMDQQAWRRDGRDSDAGHYLRFLQSAGYPLSDVEKFAISSKTVS